MKLERYKNVLFDRIIVDYSTIIEILKSGTPIGNVLSYSFGSNYRIMKKASEVNDIIEIARQNIKKYNLGYTKNPDKPKKIVDGKIFSIVDNGEGFILLKDGKKIV